MFNVIETIRRYKWQLIAVEAVSVIAFACCLIYSIDKETYSYSILFAFAFCFIATLAFFPLYYLNLFGNPALNGTVIRFILKVWFWAGVIFCTFFWVLMFFHFVYKAAVGF